MASNFIDSQRRNNANVVDTSTENGTIENVNDTGATTLQKPVNDLNRIFRFYFLYSPRIWIIHKTAHRQWHLIS